MPNRLAHLLTFKYIKSNGMNVMNNVSNVAVVSQLLALG